jgi:ATP-dependent DNA ligase
VSFQVMLAKDYNPARVASWQTTFIEPKMDGVRVITHVDDRNDDEAVRIYSRNGRRLYMFEHLRAPLLAAWRALKKEDLEYKNGIMLDGEMTGTDFGDISGAIHTKDFTAKTAIFHMFQVIPLNSFLEGLDTRPQGFRYAVMKHALLPIVREHDGLNIVPRLPATSDINVQKVYQGFRRNGLEGAMVKDYGTPWIAKRTYAWMKMKGEVTIDIRIVGFKPGRGKYAGTLGALICEHNGVRVSVSGMTDALRNEMWNNQSKYKGMYVEVMGHEETKHGSIRHPRFKRLRSDK